MISPELLRRFPFFGFLDDMQLKEVAMLAEEIDVEQGTNIFEGEQPAAGLYVMVGRQHRSELQGRRSRGPQDRQGVLHQRTEPWRHLWPVGGCRAVCAHDDGQGERAEQGDQDRGERPAGVERTRS